MSEAGAFGKLLGFDEVMKVKTYDDISVLGCAIIKWEDGCLQPRRKASPDAEYASTLILDFATPRTMRNTFLLFKPQDILL